MSYLLGFFLLLALAGCVALAVLWLVELANSARTKTDAQAFRTSAEGRNKALAAEVEKLRTEVAKLAKWANVANAEDRARQMLQQAKATLSAAEAQAQALTLKAEEQRRQLIEEARSDAMLATAEGRAQAKRLTDQAQAAIAIATDRANQIIAEANTKAEEIAGKAYEVVRNAEFFERTVRAMKNIISGYGDEYLKPAASLLDDLAEEFAHKDAGQQLKLARDHTKDMIKSGQASKCEYVESGRREGAERFVLDAFNGKVDSILSRVRHDNYGKLEQEICDSFIMVNFGGKAFREARITDEYLDARLSELKWAVIAQELKKQEQEEQRRIREQIREEERARREYEKAIREAAKEEDMLRKAMAKAEAQIAAATEEQRALFEAQLAGLQAKLHEAEERNQRALSMAQQTRRGHVYVISNIGSFGENVYKIGLTRRLEPLDRVKELGDASVPFEFDVHAVILSDDAPALETQLHRHFVLNQLNKVNHRKEFFRANLEDIRREIEELGIEAKWTMVAEAREFRETLAIEQAIESNPQLRDQWLSRQLTLDPVDEVESEGVGTVAE